MSEQPKPVAWAVIGDDYEYATLLAEHAGAVAEEEGGKVVPLYHLPTLTDEEREAVEWYAAHGAGHHSSTLRNLLERLG